MPRYRAARKATNWARFAMKWGLLLTDAAMWEAIAEDLRHAASSVSDRVKRQYEYIPRREESLPMVIRGGPDWYGRVTSLIGGIGIGVGIGLLFAPSSGEETREAIRDKAADLTNRVGEAAARTMQFRSSTDRAVTGTNGD